MSPKAIAFPADKQFALQVNFKGDRIISVHAGPTLSNDALSDLLRQIEHELAADPLKMWGSDILFASRPVKGSFRFKAAPIQILPAPARAPRPSEITAEHPFVLEYSFQATQVSALRTMRRYKTLSLWARILNAFIDGRIRHPAVHARGMWSVRSGRINRSSWRQEFYNVPGYPRTITRLSRPRRTRIAIVPADKYRGDMRQLAPLFADGTVPLDEFFLPDDLDQLIEAYLRLNDAQRARFLRSATAIYLSREVWESSVSSSFLACIQAIEALTERSTRAACAICGLDTSDGPTRRVKGIIKKYCGNLNIDERVLNKLYAVRSAISHGYDLFQFDRGPWLSGTAFNVASLNDFESIEAGARVAKRVLRGWLMDQAN